MAVHLPNCIGWCLVVWIKKSSVPERNITGNELHETIIRLGQFLPEPTTYSSWIGYCKAQKKKHAREFRVLWLSGIIWDEYIYIYWFWIKWCEKICIFNIFTPLPPNKIESSPGPEVVVSNRISPASFPTDHRPNIIKQSDAKKLMSATKPSVVVFELGGLNFNLTDGEKSPNVDGQRPSKKHKKWQIPQRWDGAKFPCLWREKQFKDHKRPTKNPGSKSSRLSTKIVFPILGDFFSKFCRHRNYLLSRLGECSPILWLKSGHHQGSEAGPESWP